MPHRLGGVLYKKILVPIDGSRTAAVGLREAIRIGKVHGARLRLIFVVDGLPVPGAADELGITRLRRAGESILADAEAAARAGGVSAETKLLEHTGGHAGVHILWEAQGWPADLIICGTHGQRGTRGLVTGSDAEYILRRSSVPVLLMPSHLANLGKAA